MERDDEELKDAALEDLSGEVEDYTGSSLKERGITIHLNFSGPDAHPVAQPDLENPREKSRDEYEKLLDKMSGK